MKNKGKWYLLSKYLDENGITYQQYLDSEHWQDVRRRFKASGLCTIWGRKKCWLCHKEGKLNVHHKTYARLGKEWLTDLQLLCQECHGKLHKELVLPDGKHGNLWTTSRKFLRNGRKAWKKANQKEKKRWVTLTYEPPHKWNTVNA